jgi:hypothetical protein
MNPTDINEAAGALASVVIGFVIFGINYLWRCSHNQRKVPKE